MLGEFQAKISKRRVGARRLKEQKTQLHNSPLGKDRPVVLFTLIQNLDDLAEERPAQASGQETACSSGSAPS